MQYQLKSLIVVVTALAVALWLSPYFAAAVFGSMLTATLLTVALSRIPRWRTPLKCRSTFTLYVACLSPAIFVAYFLSVGPAICAMQAYMEPNPGDPLQRLIFLFYSPLYAGTDNALEPLTDWYVSWWVDE